MMVPEKPSKVYPYIFIAALAVALIFVSFFYFQQDRLVRYDTLDSASLHTDANGDTFIEVGMQNVSMNEYNASGSYFVAYHVYDAAGDLLLWDGLRTEIDLQPGEWKMVKVLIDSKTLTSIGTVVGIDLIRDGSYWFSQRNNRIQMIELTNP
jgi:hypothetical protein